MAQDLVDAAISRILSAIADNQFAPGSALPREQDLANWLEVSRPTMREAVRTLAERGVLKVVHGRGTFVVEPSQWRDLPSMIWWLSRNTSSRDLGMYLVELRRMIEVGACGLAAERRTDADLQRMSRSLEEFDACAETGDMEGVARADLNFHQALLSASGNPFLSAIMQPLEHALHASRRDTTAIAEVRTRAQAHHRNILACIEAGDANRAKEAMRAHMTQTRRDIEHFVNDRTN